MLAGGAGIAVRYVLT